MQGAGGTHIILPGYILPEAGNLGMVDMQIIEYETLTPVQARVLGVLIEKAVNTPKQYPLTLNAATLACNQKHSRDPAMNLTEGEVGRSLRQLEEMQWVRSDFGTRSERFEHRCWRKTRQHKTALSLLSQLILRGPQTIAELQQRATKHSDINTLEDVETQLGVLLQCQVPMIIKVKSDDSKQDDRWQHLLCQNTPRRSDADASPPLAVDCID